MARYTAFESILITAGMPAAEAKHVAKTLDRLRLCSKGADDYAAILFAWRDMCVQLALLSRDGVPTRRVGLPDAESFGWLDAS